MTRTVRFVVNGESKEYSGDAVPATVADLVLALGLDAEMVVAEVNGDVVKRREYPARALADGDVIELVNFVGGG